jgi:hypothetical protein
LVVVVENLQNVFVTALKAKQKMVHFPDGVGE